MTEVRIGDIRMMNSWVYAVTYWRDDNNYSVIYEDGEVKILPKTSIEKDKFIKHYNTWQEAIASKEFTEC